MNDSPPMKSALLLSIFLVAPLHATSIVYDLVEAGSGNTLQAMSMSSPYGSPVVAATNSGLFATGTNNILHGIGSGAFGHANTVWMKSGLAVGTNNKVGQEQSLSNGHTGSMAIGDFNQVQGPNSLFVGEGNSSSFDYNWDIDDGARRMLIVGSWNHSYGQDSLIVGTNNSIYLRDSGMWIPAQNTATIGAGLISRYSNCLLVGQNNEGAAVQSGDSSPLFVVGNGTSTSARADAFVVKANGDIVITKPQGDISMGIYGD